VALKNSLTLNEQTLLNKSLNNRNRGNRELLDNLDKILIELQKSNKKSQKKTFQSIVSSIIATKAADQIDHETMVSLFDKIKGALGI
jgi:SAM-dependent MidA family methyltransferase